MEFIIALLIGLNWGTIGSVLTYDVNEEAAYTTTAAALSDKEVDTQIVYIKAEDRKKEAAVKFVIK